MSVWITSSQEEAACLSVREKLRARVDETLKGLKELSRAIVVVKMSGNGRMQRATLPSQELLDDLCSRFVLNVPDEDLQSFERILFLVEQAHWFYEDNTMEQNASLKTLTLRDFTSLMFQSCAALRPYIAHIDDIYKDFTSYKIRVPVTGAIILDDTFERCLLVKGWKPGATWSFPRGKKNKDEEDHTCAVREVLEETGFDISSRMTVEQHLEVVIGQQRMRLYIIPGVSKDTSFAPQTKKEISEIAWHRVDELPVASNEAHSHNRGPTGMKYFMVWPFVGPLKKWIHVHRAAAVPKTDVAAKGTTVWKVKPNGGTHSQSSSSAGTSSVPPPAASQSVKTAAPPMVKPAASAMVKPAADLAYLAHPVRENPGGSFRNFRFDRARVMQTLGA